MRRDLVMAVDPGEETGWVFWWEDGSTKFGTVMEYGEDDQMSFLARAEAWLAVHGDRFTIVCETFVITTETAKKSPQHWSLEIFGTLKYLAWKYRADFVSYSASSAKRFSKNDKLRAINWYRPGKRHATDAHRHLLLYLVEDGRILPDALLDKVELDAPTQKEEPTR